jgi:hypothetical protein
MWTEARVEYLCTLKEQGLSRAEIGQRMGISKNAVTGKLDRLNGPRPVSRENLNLQKWGEEETTKLRNLWSSNRVSVASIAQFLNRSIGSCRHKANALGLSRPPGVIRKKHIRPNARGPRKPQVAKPIPIPPIPDPDYETCIGLLDLAHDSCRWPYGSPVKYCGAKVAGKKLSYCPGHMARAYGGQPKGQRFSFRRVA